VVKGTRIAVELVVELLAQGLVLELLAQGWETDEILQEYPALQLGDVQACLHYASETLKSERVYPLAAEA
jgi:uncharacterized protein (DUF433 family)